MLFELYGDTCITQLLGWVLVFAGLVLMNEIGRRTKAGGILVFIIIPLALTVYFIVANAAAAAGAPWAVNNPTVVYMGGWFHYAKLYAADIGCVGFMMIKYKWGIGKQDWFKVWPWLIVSINILIAVASDLESFFKGIAAGGLQGGWWYSVEGVWLYGGWWNLVNAIAGVINCLCMTGCWSVFSSKDQKDMVWADMTVWFIVAYDIWNFEYTYLNLPTHTWYCGVALLLAPTFANAFWNKGGWIQNRANTLAIWCMFAQVFPLFQISEKFSVLPSVYGKEAQGLAAIDLTTLYAPGANSIAENVEAVAAMSGADRATLLQTVGVVADPTMQGVVALAALVANVLCITVIIKRAMAKPAGQRNPYKYDVFVGTRDYEEARARVEDGAKFPV